MVSLAVAVILVVAATAPFARIVLTGTEGLLPAYAAAVLLVELITAALLFGHFATDPAPGVLVLAVGYLFSALLVPSWALTFPGMFEAFGLGEVVQGTAYIAAIRRIGFPVFVLVYASTKSSRRLPYTSTRRLVLGSVCGVALAAIALPWAIVNADGALPPLMRDARFVADLWSIVPLLAMALYLAGLSILWVRRTSSLDLWLMIVLGTLAVELVLLSYISGGIRLSIGWWVGRLFGLTSASIVLVALLSETTLLYARLARSVAAERRERESRLTAMEAMSATIAHEITQPVASMVTNARRRCRGPAGMRVERALVIATPVRISPHAREGRCRMTQRRSEASTMRAWICRGYGGPEVLALEDRPKPAPRENETRFSSGSVPPRSLPATCGCARCGFQRASGCWGA